MPTVKTARIGPPAIPNILNEICTRVEGISPARKARPIVKNPKATAEKRKNIYFKASLRMGHLLC
jgi:hypothetical protein